MPLNTKDVLDQVVAYEVLRSQGNRSTFIGPIHSDLNKDMLTVTSNPPKRSAASFGNRRSSINLVRSISTPTPDGDTEIKDMKFELNASIPVGATDSDISEALARISMLDVADIKEILVVGKTQH